MKWPAIKTVRLRGWGHGGEVARLGYVTKECGRRIMQLYPRNHGENKRIHHDHRNLVTIMANPEHLQNKFILPVQSTSITLTDPTSLCLDKLPSRHSVWPIYATCCDPTHHPEHAAFAGCPSQVIRLCSSATALHPVQKVPDRSCFVLPSERYAPLLTLQADWGSLQ